jgi:hypothetical protein
VTRLAGFDFLYQEVSYPAGTGISLSGGKVAGTWSWPLPSILRPRKVGPWVYSRHFFLESSRPPYPSSIISYTFPGFHVVRCSDGSMLVSYKLFRRFGRTCCLHLQRGYWSINDSNLSSHRENGGERVPPKRLNKRINPARYKNREDYHLMPFHIPFQFPSLFVHRSVGDIH